MRALAQVLRAEPGRVLAAVLVGSTAHLGAAALAGACGWLLARAVDRPPTVGVTVAVAAAHALGLGRAALRFGEETVGQDAASRVTTHWREEVYVDLDQAGPVASARLRSGDVLTRIIDDIEAVHGMLVRGVVPLVAGVVASAVATAVLLLWYLPAGLVLLGGSLLAGVVVPWWGVRAIRRSERRLALARGDLASVASELLAGRTDLEAAGALGPRLHRVRELDAGLRARARRTARSAGLAAGGVVLVIGATVVAEIAVGLLATRAGALSDATVAVPALIALVVLDSTGRPGEVVRALGCGLEAVARLRSLRRLPRLREEAGWLPLPRGPLRLEVTALSVRWPDAAEPALRDVDLTLRPGRRLGVVGESGAGKTTLITALLGFLPPETGSVRISGHELSDIDELSLRRAVAVCSQDAHLFDTTIRNNLLLARPDATVPDLVEALRRARLEHWIRTLPLGLDTPVGARGIRLSGGERQRLALARALLVDPSVLLLDEPTAGLDEPTAAALMRDLLVATAGRTTLLVTHRLAGLSVLDEIVVLADGRVVQRGTPTELMEVAGPYRRMWFRSAAAASSLSGLAPTAPGAR